MTWIIGNSGIFGYCLIMGDTMVTLEYPNGDRKYFDGLQKVHPISDSFAAGFAGNVELGFMFIQNLREELEVLHKGNQQIPDYFMYRHCERQAKRLYNLKSKDKKQPLEIMIMGISPVATDTEDGRGLPRTHGYILKAPDFEIQKIKRNKFYSIGLGSTVGLYRDKLNELNENDYNNLMQMEVGHTGRYGVVVSDYLREIVSDNPPQDGISRHFTTTLVYRGKVETGIRRTMRVNDDGTLSKDDTPVIYQNWSDIKAQMQKQLGDISQAECIA